MNDDLAIPSFLKRTGVAKPFRAPRWKKFPKAERPEGEKWTEAKRWEVHLHDEVPKLGCGQHRIWVVEGRRWARLSDGVAKIKVPMALWSLVRRTGKEVK
jgi:hypothetical protein